MQQFGRYELIRKLATGGMAEVFLAKAKGPMGFEKTLVVKRILPHLAEDPAFVEMFLNEAKLSAQISHHNIVQIFDFGEVEGQYFLAMEYIDGLNLRTLLTRLREQSMELSVEICAHLVAQACEGLAFAHDFRNPETSELLYLVHRDISPDNLLVSSQGMVKVADFGIARSDSQKHETREGIVKGKLPYMPPEQVRAWALDRRVDVYALGIVLYELLTGHRPFQGANETSVLEAILFKPMVPPTDYRPELPPALEIILEKALAGDRDQRYPDCMSLAADLEEFILSQGKPVTSQQVALLVAMVMAEPEKPAGTTPPPEVPSLPLLPPLEPAAPRSGKPSAGSAAKTASLKGSGPAQLSSPADSSEEPTLC